MNLELSLKITEWNKTLQQYISFTGKTAEEATYRQAKNLLFFVAREMPQSRFKKGQPVSRLSDYFGYDPWVAGMVVAKHFKKQGALMVKSMHTHRKVTGRAFMTTGSRGRAKFVGWQKDSRSVYFTKEMAIKENAKRVRQINARFGFALLIPMKALDALKAIAKSKGINIGSFSVKGNKPNKKHQGEAPMISIKKTNNRIDVSIASAYTFKTSKTMFGKSQDANAQFYDNAIKQALPRAMSNAIADMKQYMATKIAEKARKINK
jgi:hypothetical protein